MTSEGVFSEHEARALAEALLEQAAPWVIVGVREFPVGWVFIWDRPTTATGKPTPVRVR